MAARAAKPEVSDPTHTLSSYQATTTEYERSTPVQESQDSVMRSLNKADILATFINKDTILSKSMFKQF